MAVAGSSFLRSTFVERLEWHSEIQLERYLQISRGRSVRKCRSSARLVKVRFDSSLVACFARSIQFRAFGTLWDRPACWPRLVRHTIPVPKSIPSTSIIVKIEHRTIPHRDLIASS
jgi:hypothetical protein